MKYSDTEYNDSPWEWRPVGLAALGVADPGSDGSWEWRSLGVAESIGMEGRLQLSRMSGGI